MNLLNMIGVFTGNNHRETVQEFFQLFKTPWTFATSGEKYRVLITNDYSGDLDSLNADLVIITSPHKLPLDAELGVRFHDTTQGGQICRNHLRIPIYRQLSYITMPEPAQPILGNSTGCVAWSTQKTGTHYIRIGYDLFEEAAFLLNSGQPPSEALVPTLDEHIDFLRSRLLHCGIEFVEIPPFPPGHDFICCLTHDIDFHEIRRHRLDHTTLGFLYRSLVRSAVEGLNGSRSWSRVRANWTGAISLPLVFLGVKDDPWRPFDDYPRVENGLKATYFVVPFKDRPGCSPSGTSNPKRAVRYQISDVRSEILRLNKQGHEVAVHGLDAWHDPQSAVAEKNELTSVTGQVAAGVRMHWLYWDQKSPEVLDRAEFSYDSTLGYNEAVGYRNGTTQCFRLPGARELMELPLHVQDTALFFPARMNLTEQEAFVLLETILSNNDRFGGVLTVNWHDRSLAPERLWGDFYGEMLNGLKKRTPWFATAGEATCWFRERRKLEFDSSFSSPGVWNVLVRRTEDSGTPFRIRHYVRNRVQRGQDSLAYRDTVLDTQSCCLQLN